MRRRAFVKKSAQATAAMAAGLSLSGPLNAAVGEDSAPGWLKTFAVECTYPIGGDVVGGGTYQGKGNTGFMVPFPGPAVLYLRAA